MSTSSLHHFTSYPATFSATSSTRMSHSLTPGLDTLAEGSQYALEQLQLSRDADITVSLSAGAGHDEKLSQPGAGTRNASSGSNGNGGGVGNVFHNPTHRDALADARSAIRKNSSSAPVRRRISRACDQCNQLRTKCDGQNPCAHCIGKINCTNR